MPPTVHVDNPGTSSTEFVASEAAPKIKFYTKRWTPSQTPPVAGAVFIHGALRAINPLLDGLASRIARMRR